MEERCRHRSERPFISSLGRWTLHLISNKGNFSILQPVYGDTATELGFYCFSFAASLYLLLEKSSSLSLDFAFHFPTELFPPPCTERETAAKSFEFQQRGLWGLCSFFGDRLSFFVGAKSMGAQLSKTAGKAETAVEKPGEAAASPTKTNGQVNDILKSSSSHPSRGESGRSGERGMMRSKGAIRA